jgi:hypothetical protein
MQDNWDWYNWILVNKPVPSLSEEVIRRQQEALSQESEESAGAKEEK